MNFPATLTVPVHFRTELATYIAIGFALAIGFATSLLYRAHTITVTHTVRQSIQSQYGKPTQSVAGAQVNAAFKGLTCSIYQSKKTVICAP